ncbi:apolipoprotein N-acyltransferase [Paraglaciecola aestuariivivens]
MTLVLALALGGLLTLAYAPFSFWWLTFISLSGLVYLLAESEPKHSTKIGFAFGLGWFGAGISWVHVSIADFGGLPLIGSLGLMLLLSAYLALFPALACYLLTRYFKQVLFWPLVLPLIWLSIEWLRSWFLTGFPWLSLGYSQLNSPLASWFAVIGEFGVTALVIILASALTLWLTAKKWWPSLFLILVVGLSSWVITDHPWVTTTGKEAKVALVQGNIPQALRWTPEQDQPTMQKYQYMTAAHWQSDLIIWPEAAVPKIEPAALDYLHALDKQAAQTNTALITGIVNYNFESREAFNNLITLGQKTSQALSNESGHYHYLHANRYAKHHLLPIGEFIPLEDWIRGLAPIFDLPMSSFSRGDYQQANLQAKGFALAPAICFEIAFPKQIAANLYSHTDFIITVSNDAWFGASHGPAQHLEIAQVRAKEFGLPVLRATNNGITAIIDHQGKIQSRLPQFEAAVLSDRVKQVTGQTPYRKLEEWPTWLVCLLLFLVGCYQQKRNTD